MKKIIIYVLLLSFFVVRTMYDQKFIPSKETCGATISLREGAKMNDFQRGLQCMISGYKNVYFGPTEDPGKTARLPNGIKKILVLDGESLILYTPQGEKNAKLLEHYLNYKYKKLNHFMKIFKDYEKPQKKYEKIYSKNDYLIGHLLGYSENDIEFFYTRNKQHSKYESDRKKSEKFIDNPGDFLVWHDNFNKHYSPLS